MRPPCQKEEEEQEAGWPSTADGRMEGVAQLLLQRELGPAFSTGRRSGASSASADLKVWAEADFLRHSSSSYIEFSPPPRSSIAAAFSPDAKWLASTQ